MSNMGGGKERDGKGGQVHTHTALHYFMKYEMLAKFKQDFMCNVHMWVYAP